MGYARHQVVVTEPHDDLEPDRFGAMAFDIDAGIYWRPEEGGLLWGMSNPEERPGPGRTIDWPYLKRMQRRLARLVPVTAGLGIKKAWAATIEYTPDHLPLLGPLVTRDGDEVDGATIASACGHGMMWGPAVARDRDRPRAHRHHRRRRTPGRLPDGQVRCTRDAHRSWTRWRCPFPVQVDDD